jgi:hypothetical protein
VLWAFWHLPFVVTGEDIWVDALLFPIEWSIVYTWLFNNAKGSVLIVMLFPCHRQSTCVVDRP